MKNCNRLISILISIFLLIALDYKQEIVKKEKIKIITLLPNYIQPGETLLVQFEGDINLEKIKVKFANKDLPLIKFNKNIFTIIGLDIQKPSGKYSFIVYLKNSSGKFKEFYKTEIQIYQSQRISIDFGNEPKRSKKFLNKYQKERRELKSILNKLEKKPLFNSKFGMPLKKIKITGEFGEKRVYKNKRTRIHRGVDLFATKGTKVYAINSGKILIAKYFTFEGNCVVIDHGVGIVSFYMHLDKFKVKEGDFVKKGQVVGLAGSTGNSRSPHLHFAIKINNNETVDPLKFIELINEYL